MAPPWRIRSLASTASTNDEARALAEAGEEARVVVVAERQTAGRGRRGRAWSSEPGGLYLSALLRPTLPAARIGLLPLAAGVAVASVVEGLGLVPELRWPNDVHLPAGKLAGVLCESRLRASPPGGHPGAGPPAGAEGGPGLAWAVVGIGLNVRQDPAGLAAAGGTSLARAGCDGVAPSDLVGPVLQALDERVAQAEGSPGALVAAWSRRAPMLGGPVVLRTESGVVRGRATRVALSGALVVAAPEREVEVLDPDLVRVELSGQAAAGVRGPGGEAG